MTRKPAYIVTGAYSGLVGLASVVIGGMLLYECLVRLSWGDRSIEELLAGLGFLIGGIALGLFTATTIRKFTTQSQEMLLDGPEPATQLPTLSRFQKMLGIVGVLGALALLAFTLWLFMDVYERFSSNPWRDIPTQAKITMAVMFVGVVCILHYFIGTLIVFRKRKPTPATT